MIISLRIKTAHHLVPNEGLKGIRDLDVIVAPVNPLVHRNAPSNLEAEVVLDASRELLKLLPTLNVLERRICSISVQRMAAFLQDSMLMPTPVLRIFKLS